MTVTELQSLLASSIQNMTACPDEMVKAQLQKLCAETINRLLEEVTPKQATQDQAP